MLDLSRLIELELGGAPAEKQHVGLGSELT
jgi:hypothetical protein